jgi:very-short-patch-repair endonuclease
MAAVLACGSKAVLSHHAAAALWEIRPRHHGPIDVTITGGQARQRKGVRVHRTTLDRRHITRHHDIPITTPTRTLTDLAATLRRRDLDRAIEQALILRLTNRATLLQCQNPRLARALDHEPALTRSEAEARLLELIRAAELPPPLTNTRIHGHEVDFYWPAQRLVIEVDGYTYHHTRQAFERDRLRDSRLQAHAVRINRVTWRQIAHTPTALIARIAATIATTS